MVSGGNTKGTGDGDRERERDRRIEDEEDDPIDEAVIGTDDSSTRDK